MKRADLTQYQKNRFSKSRLCPICKAYIFDDEELDFVVRPIGRSKLYIFYHSDCLKGGANNGKEKIQEKEKTGKSPVGSVAEAVSKIFTPQISFSSSCRAEG